jgi:hypothetical protein
MCLELLEAQQRTGSELRGTRPEDTEALGGGNRGIRRLRWAQAPPPQPRRPALGWVEAAVASVMMQPLTCCLPQVP